MKKTVQMGLLVSCFTLSLSVAATGIAGDQVESESPPPIDRRVSREGAERIRALENFIAAMRNPRSPERARKLVEALKADPASPAPLKPLAESVRSREEAQKIAPELNAVSAAHPAEFPLALLAAGIDRRAGNSAVERAARLRVSLETVSRPDELAQPRLNLWLALSQIYLDAMLESEQYDAAAEWMEDAPRPSSPEAADRQLQAFAEFCRIAALRLPEERRWLGLLPGKREEFLDRFREFLEELLRREERFTRPEQYLSRIGFYEKVGEAREALRLARQFYRRYPSKESLTMLAYAAVAVPDLPELESVLAEMKKQYPDLLKLGELLYANGLLEAGEVIRARERLDRLADPETRLDFELQLLQSEKRYAELRDRILARKEKGEKLREIHVQLLLMAAEKLRDTALLEKVHKFLAADGLLTHPNYANSVGYVSAELNVNLEEAERLIRHALSVDARNPAYLDSLAWVLYRLGKFKEADVEIRRAIRFALPGVEQGTIYWHAGEIAAVLGNRDEARRFLLMALAERDRELDRAAVEKRLSELESAR